MSDGTRTRPHRRQLRQRQVCDEGDDSEDNTAEAARLEALRSMQRMRGTRQYRATQLDVLRNTSEIDISTSGSSSSSDTKAAAAQTADPQDITDHSKQMFVLFCFFPSKTLLVPRRHTQHREEYIAQKLREKRDGTSSSAATAATAATAETKEDDKQTTEPTQTKEKENTTDGDNDLDQQTSFARVAEVALPAAYRERNIRATEEATRAFFAQRQREQERLAADPLARFGRVPDSLPQDEGAERRARDSGRATDALVYERFVKHARRF